MDSPSSFLTVTMAGGGILFNWKFWSKITHPLQNMADFPLIVLQLWELVKNWVIINRKLTELSNELKMKYVHYT